MTAPQSATKTSEAAIFARVWDGSPTTMTPELARQILRLGFADSDKDRMHTLAERNQAGSLLESEREELDNYIRVGDLLAILQSKARQFLNKTGGGANGHG